MIGINEISTSYNVRKINLENIDEVYDLCKKNVMYYEHLKEELYKEGIKEDMFALPPGKTIKDKYYIGFYENSELVAVMDLIKGYPNDETAYIGFFMMNVNKQGLGIGTNIIEELRCYLSNTNTKFIRLAYVVGNKQGENFWRKNGFIPTGDLRPRGEVTVAVMERGI